MHAQKKRSAEEVLQDSLKASAKQENIDATGKVDCKIESGKKSSSSSGSSMNLALDLNLKGQNLKKDGNNVVAYSIDGKELGKYLKQESNKNSKGTSNSTLSLDDVNIKSMKGSRTLNDKDLPLKESITLVVENKKKSKTNNNMFSGLTNGKTTVKINVTYKNPGKSVSVTLPKDLSSYKLQKK